jgi:hypothetical protein
MSLEQNSVEVRPRRQWPKISADRWLSLAAAPAFAIMALLTAMPGGAAPDFLCSAAGASPLGGMIPMYLLMSAFHSAPWLKLIAKFLRTTKLGPYELGLGEMKAWRNFSKGTMHE